MTTVTLQPGTDYRSLVDDRLTSTSLFSTYTPTTTAVHNEDCFVSDLDWSGVGWYWTGGASDHYGGAIVNRRYMLMSEHYPGAEYMQALIDQAGGLNVYLTDADGVFHKMTVESYVAIYGDIMMVKFTTDVPDLIKPYPVLPANYASYIGALDSVNDDGVHFPMLMADQEQKFTIHDCIDITIPKTINGDPSSDATRLQYWEAGVEGDSGHPNFVLLPGNVLTLVTCNQGTAYGPFYPLFIDVINAAMDEGYELDVISFTIEETGDEEETEETEEEGDTMTEYQYIDYAILLERVGHAVFGNRSEFSTDNTTDIENAINDGLRDVYAAHDWSFFHPVTTITTVAPYSTGTVEIEDGVVTLTDDVGSLTEAIFPTWAAYGVLKVNGSFYEVSSRGGDNAVTLEDTSVAADELSTYELRRYEYDLPTGYEKIDGELTYEPGESDFYPPVKQRHDSEIQRKRQDNDDEARPLYFSVRTIEFDPTVGSRRQLILYPTPDDEYILYAKMTLRPTSIDATNKYPVGGEKLSQLILEACLASAERLYDGAEGIHTKRFQELLPLAIMSDQEASSPTTLGPNSPRGENANYARGMQFGNITLNGEPL